MSNWISVDDQLPAYGQMVITFDRKAGGVYFGDRICTDGSGEVWKRADGWGKPDGHGLRSGNYYRPTHWMPMPEPPETI